MLWRFGRRPSPLKGSYRVGAANGSEAIRFHNGSVIELLVSTLTNREFGRRRVLLHAGAGSVSHL